MVTGTPANSFDNSSIKEVIADGILGFVVDDVDQAVKTLERLDTINQKGFRKHVEEHFTVDTMTEGYIQVYEKILKR